MSAQDLDGESNAEADGNGEMPKPHTIRPELVDEPGRLLTVLESISDNDGNLLSIFHEYGSLTPCGHTSAEVDLECPPDRFTRIIEALCDAGVDATRAGAGYFGEEVMVILADDIADSDLSDTLHRIKSSADVMPQDLPLSAREGTDEASSARLRLAIRSECVDKTLRVVRNIATEKELHAVEPLAEGSQ